MKRKVKIAWSSNFAYAIGLIATDGCLNKNGKKIWFSSKDLEMLENLKKALGVQNRIGRYARGGEKEKKYYCITIGDKTFWNYLHTIDITTTKSKTIQRVDVPKKHFPDFLRGVFDGDGSFYTFWDKRWPKAFGYIISFASASQIFLDWFRLSLQKQFGVKGFIRRGDGVFEIRYTKRDTRTLVRSMYYRPDLLFLSRKYHKIKSAFAFDENLHPDRKKIYAAVAQW